jgi:hypothetical protein
VLLDVMHFSSVVKLTFVSTNVHQHERNVIGWWALPLGRYAIEKWPASFLHSSEGQTEGRGRDSQVTQPDK